MIKLDDKTYGSLLPFLNSGGHHNIYAKYKMLRKLPSEEYLKPDATGLAKLFQGGVTYKAQSMSMKDCHILWCRTLTQQGHGLPSTTSGPWPPSYLVALRITLIFSHQRFFEGQWLEETFLAVKNLAPLSEGHVCHNFYHQYKHAGGFLCYDRYLPNIEILRPSAIVPHFAHTSMNIRQIGKHCAHVMPLDRVSESDRFAVYISGTVTR